MKVMSSGHPDFKAGNLCLGDDWMGRSSVQPPPSKLDKVDFIEQFNEELLVKKEGENPQILGVIFFPCHG